MELLNNNLIDINNLTKDYGNQRGIFNIDLSVYKGEMIGIVGTNGSGKTTTIRSILGFIKPTNGKVKVNGLSSWQNQSEIAKLVGYVPGEIAFPDLKTGTAFIKSQADFLNLKDLSYADELIKKLQLDPQANLKRMSKGMKQKTAIVAALMNDNPIIILDEPTTGLDPLMRDAFLEIIKSEHKKGKTIIMSSHMFNEMEDTCDRVALISNGKIVSIADMKKIRNSNTSEFKIEFVDRESFEKFKNLNINIIRIQDEYNQCTIEIEKIRINDLFNVLKKFNVKFISEQKYTLEKYFDEVMEDKNERKEK